MPIDKNKIAALAQKYTAKGQLDKAIVEYKKLIEAEPNDIRTWLKIGDLYTRKGARTEATETYLRVAEQYTKSGFHLKAIAVYKQILKLDPTMIDVHQYLAGSYLDLGLTSEALIQLEQLADMYQRTERQEDLLKVLLRMGDIDPKNVATRLRIAEHLSKEERGAEAVEHFQLAADELKKQGRIEDYLKVTERLLYHAPSRTALARETAKIYMDRGQYKHALAKLQACFVTDPRDLNTLEMLCEAFQGLGQPDKAVSVYKEMALILKNEGQQDRYQKVLRQILKLDPENELALRGLGKRESSSALGSKPDRGSGLGLRTRAQQLRPTGKSGLAKRREQSAVAKRETSAVAKRETSVVARRETSVVARRETSVVARRETSTVKHVPEPDKPLTEAQVAEKARTILTETEVLIKYGLNDRAVDHLNQVFTFDPYNIDARERLRDVLLLKGDREGAMRQLFVLAEAFRDSQPEGSIYYCHEVLKIDPVNARARKIIASLGGVMPEGIGAEAADDGIADYEPSPEETEVAGFEDEESVSIEREVAETVMEDDSGLLLDDAEVISAGKEPLGADPSGIIVGAPRAVAAAEDSDRLSSERAPRRKKSEGLGFSLAPPRRQDAILPPPKPLSSRSAHFAADSEDPESPLYRGGREEAPRDTSDSWLDIDQSAGVDAEDSDAGLAKISIDDEPLEGETTDVTGFDSISDIPPADKTDVVDFDTVALEDAVRRDIDRPMRRPAAPAFEEAEERTEVVEADSLVPPPSGKADYDEEAIEAIDEGLEEVAFYLDQDLFDEAQAILRDLVTKYGDHPKVRAALESFNQRRQAAMAQTDEPEEAPGPELPEEETRVEPQQQIALSDFTTHYDLGLAYKEMGLFKEAIKEFDLAAGDPEKLALSRLMTSMCYSSLNRFDEAIEVLKECLRMKGLERQQKLGMLYELGIAYQAAKKKKNALACFEKLAGFDPNFADVQARIEALTTGKSIPPKHLPF